MEGLEKIFQVEETHNKSVEALLRFDKEDFKPKLVRRDEYPSWRHYDFNKYILIMGTNRQKGRD